MATLASTLLSGGASRLLPATTAPPSNHLFAERLRQIGAEFDREVQQSFEAAVQNVEGENRLLRGEVEWLQRQLEDERQQSAARLGLCAEFKRQLEEMQEAHRNEIEVREYWRREAESHEEQKSLLEAKFAAITMAEKEADCSSSVPRTKLVASRSPAGAVESPSRDLSHFSSEEGADGKIAAEVFVDEAFDSTDPAVVERFLTMVEAMPSTSRIEPKLQSLALQDVHSLLLAAVGRGNRPDRHEGAIATMERIVRLWVRRLLNFRGIETLQAAIASGSAEALGVLLSLGGFPSAASSAPKAGLGSRSFQSNSESQVDSRGTTSTKSQITAASASSQAADDQSAEQSQLLCLCVRRGDAEMLNVLLEHLHESGRRFPGPMREARALALSLDNSELASILGSHLIVELSVLGNCQYRQTNFAEAAAVYQEALECCEQGTLHAHDDDSQATPSEARRRQRENIVRLRYNLARASHRLDRWAQAREHCTVALELDPGYVNAYVLRAQAAMAGFDWLAAQTDWDHLFRVHAPAVTAAAAAASRSSSAASGLQEAEALTAWQKQRLECARHLAMGHYEVLELPLHAGVDAVKRAYRDLARRWHPDKHEDKSKDHRERAARKFGRIREAYETLSDEKSKLAYDASLSAASEATGHTGASPESGHAGRDRGRSHKSSVEEVIRGFDDFPGLGHMHRKASWDSVGSPWDPNPWASSSSQGVTSTPFDEVPHIKPIRVSAGGRIRSSLLKVRRAARDQFGQRWPSGTKMDGTTSEDLHKVNLLETDIGDPEAFSTENLGTPSGRRKAQDWFAGF